MWLSQECTNLNAKMGLLLRVDMIYFRTVYEDGGRGGSICSMMESMWFQHPPIQWSWSPRSQVSVALQVPSKNRVKEDKSRTDSFWHSPNQRTTAANLHSQEGALNIQPGQPAHSKSPSIHNLSVVSGFTKFWPLMTVFLLITCNTAMNVLILFIVWM